jgi:hypothetical protein
MNSHINLQESEIAVTAPERVVSPMGKIWRTIRGYIWWSYERGTLHYDVMVTLILLFVFLSPYVIKYKDTPVEHNPHPTGLIVIPNPQGGFIYQIPAAAITPGNGVDIRVQLEKIVEPFSGAVTVTKYETVTDASGQVQSYKAWIVKE